MKGREALSFRSEQVSRAASELDELIGVDFETFMDRVNNCQDDITNWWEPLYDRIRKLIDAARDQKRPQDKQWKYQTREECEQAGKHAQRQDRKGYCRLCGWRPRWKPKNAEGVSLRDELRDHIIMYGKIEEDMLPYMESIHSEHVVEVPRLALPSRTPSGETWGQPKPIRVVPACRRNIDFRRKR